MATCTSAVVGAGDSSCHNLVAALWATAGCARASSPSASCTHMSSASGARVGTRASSTRVPSAHVGASASSTRVPSSHVGASAFIARVATGVPSARGARSACVACGITGSSFYSRVELVEKIAIVRSSHDEIILASMVVVAVFIKGGKARGMMSCGAQSDVTFASATAICHSGAVSRMREFQIEKSIARLCRNDRLSGFDMPYRRPRVLSFPVVGPQVSRPPVSPGEFLNGRAGWFAKFEP